MTFKFVPTAAPTTTTTTILTTAANDVPVNCEAGKNQTTAFTCADCAPGYTCLDPKNPSLTPCTDGSYADSTSTVCKRCEIGIVFDSVRKNSFYIYLVNVQFKSKVGKNLIGKIEIG